MLEQIQPVQNDSIAGENQEQNLAPAEVKTEAKDVQDVQPQMDAQKVIEIIESQDKALAAAETKIVSLKRKIKAGFVEEEPEAIDIEERVERKVNEILAGQKKVEEDNDLNEIQKIRRQNSELLESLRASKSISNSSLGSNQDKAKIEPDILKGFSEKEISIINYRANALGMTPREYAIKKKLTP